MAKGMMDFNEMQASDFYKGQYVQGELLELWDEFAYMEEYTETALGRKTNSRVSAHYYIMPLQTSYENDTPVFAAVCLKNVTQISAAEQMINEMNDYWDEESDGLYTSIPITGKVSIMDDELKQYFYEWLMYGDEESSTSDYDQFVCPLYYHSSSAQQQQLYPQHGRCYDTYRSSPCRSSGVCYH